MPPSGFSQKAVEGAVTFIGACYEDLQAEVAAGKHPTMEAAVEFELNQIRRALRRVHIDEAGTLTEREPVD